MTDITERLRTRYEATFLDEDAARQIEALRAERDRAVEACEQIAKRLPEWRSIETASKGDGRDYVILYDKHVCVGVWFEGRWKPIHSTETVHPTHWMPLPPKPVM